ncbi:MULTISPECIES: EscU/YscU/HrcU family type III secretion system export apparatus switch protein [Pseudomonas]|jgi:type III secretion YscU/HrpY family protein|uniref:EscU/YscU/HrcU family type III secretion system export apparatus switch protein n=1 Tax=Pseudomonas TaxID=286 RepID=UPI00099CC3F2|nr:MULTISPECIES: EscU/YscU/HrcU family type III secretion system export apparatus switch protein [Pseudomonas]MCK3838848.1 EscU/YscU/HrcU family type III secretion system export apparatus switch protein [Pseudomonas sp. NCIMB 10586]OPA97799.1 EscU/YscU/HrcU family type III secretion system export apparatus switch protein [Pseudomonas synxantha]VCU67883.1 Surface presentation of antigens protein SpaS [Pseudomonas synxantha]
MSSASKTEKPTPKKIRDSAKKGETFKARDLSSWCMMLCATVYLGGSDTLFQVMEFYQSIIASNFDADMQRYTTELSIVLFKAVAPLILVCFVANALPTLWQTRLAFASEALHIKFDALNPINGFKKLFSLRTVKDTVKSILYLGCFAVALWGVWVSERHLLFAQLYASPMELFPIWSHLLLVLVLAFLGCILLVVMLDALCEYWLYIKDLKMDKESVKREHKEQDGNPEIKSQRRNLHYELLSEQIKSDIRGSRIIVANPTHIAVGIYFRPEVTVLPFISLMETNQRALAVRKYAAEVGVPVVTDIALARRIFKTHQRYSFIQIDEIENVLRLLVWLEQVEQA